MDISSGKRVFLVALVASLVASGILAIGILLIAEFDETAGRILATTGLIGGFSLLALPAGALLDRGIARRLAWTTVVLAGAGLVVTAVLVWAGDDAEFGWKAALTIVLAAAACSQTAAGVSRRRETDPASVGALQVAATVGAFTAASMGAAAAWAEIDDTTYFRLLGALVVADLLAVLLQPALRRMAGESHTAEARIVFLVAGTPSAEGIDAARAALEAHGTRVTRVERKG
jgi:hypothetical protein